LKYTSLFFIALLGIFLVLPLFINNVSAQVYPDYYVTIKPEIIPDALTYTSVGSNVTLSFVALWSYGSNEGQNIQNATATIQVSNIKDKVIDTLSVNTTSGIFSFNYTSASAAVLAFTPTKLVTQDRQEWNSSLVDSANNVYGFTYNWAQVWWDTFHVSLVSSDTSSLGKVALSVNVTHLLLPEEGLQVESVHIPKIVHGANVTINGVKAEESQTTPGIYLAHSSTFLPTAYVNIGVSQESWTIFHTAFSFTQNVNEPLWTYSVVFGLVFSFAALMIRLFTSRKANSSSLFKNSNFPFYGATLLAATSIISLYWGLVGLEGTLHTFDWVLLASLGMFSFAFGITGVIMAIRKKYQAFAIFAATVPLFMNVVGVKTSLDIYRLTNPWLILILSLLLSIISGYLISNSDKSFQNGKKRRKTNLDTAQPQHDAIG
jgi:hypothetical protein